MLKVKKINILKKKKKKERKEDAILISQPKIESRKFGVFLMFVLLLVEDFNFFWEGWCLCVCVCVCVF